jgi:hypothetical protein
MIQKLLKRSLPLLAAASLLIATVANVGSVGATPLTITQSGPNMAIDQNVSSVTDWRLTASATALTNADGTPANVSLVFDYVDAENYYYMNLSSADASYLSGFYRVSAGTPTKILGLANRINASQAYTLEVRKASGALKLYINGTYINKVDTASNVSAKFGVGTVNGNASFDNITARLGSTTTPLSPTAVESSLPTPVIDPNQSLPTPSNPTMTSSTVRVVNVSTSAQLKAAILAAQPGDNIVLADGTYTNTMSAGNYTGSFAATVDGTATDPITISGGRNAIIDGNGTGGRYGLYFYGADYWNVDGITVANASKGIVLDGSNHGFINNVKVTNVGMEAVHFRSFSSHNVIKGSEITGTGKKSPQYGEGVYIGSANSNWATYSGGQPDRSDRNIVLNNTFTDFTAEALDLKEGSVGGYVAGNTFEGSSLSGQNSADSWVDAKGNYYLIENNVGTNALLDGFQVHNVYSGWGASNAFRANTANVNAAGYGFNVVTGAITQGNVVYCSNAVTGAGAGLSNLTCTQD